MSFVLPAGVLAISIDLELDPLRRIADQQHGLEAATDRLITLLDTYRVPATWAVADPAVSAATDRLTASGSSHEIAVLGSLRISAAGTNSPSAAMQRFRQDLEGVAPSHSAHGQA